MLPVVTFATVPGSATVSDTVTIVDLKTGTRISDTLQAGRTRVFATKARAAVYDNRSHTLLAFDPTTGAPERPLNAAASVDLEMPAEDLRYGQLWLHFEGWARPGDLPWTVIDMASWKVLHENGR